MTNITNITKNNKNWTPPSSIEEKIKEFLIAENLYLKTLKRNKPILLIELSESHTKMLIEKLINNVESYGFKAMYLKKASLHEVSLFDNEKDHRYVPIGKGNFIYNFIYFPHNLAL
jgi:hypothetical protein